MQGEPFGPYRLVRKLGEGEMGEVHEAVGPRGERVALKILRFAASGLGVRSRFLREGKLCAALRHPNVIAVSDHGIEKDSPYFVMPVLRGADLEQTLIRTGPLRPEVAVAIALQACAGVLAAHEAGIVHRDLKPANVFLDEADNGSVRAVVCDFGVAKVVDEDGSLTASGAVLGTPLYMAPEQLLDSKHVDARCDVWALGMILYHALAGEAAFHELRTLAALVMALRDNDVPPLQERAPWVPPALARVVHAALLPLDKRIATVGRLEDALLKFAVADPDLKTSSIVAVSPERKAVFATRASLPMAAADLVDPFEATALGDGPVQDDAPDPYLGRTFEERYRVVAMIGRGGMGAVYEAIDLAAKAEEGRVVALKIMHPETGARGLEATRRFVREAKASARIQSPHVTRFIDSGVDAATGGPFIVMERLRGADLASHLAATGALEVGPAVALFRQACAALSAAHALGIVHRDIKPSNLFLHREGRAIVLKVCDFGIAKQLGREGVEVSTELTRSGGLIGSPLYMSPEQAKGSKLVDERSDMFSLALTLHEALSGVRPWEGHTSMGEIIVAVCTEQVPSLSTIAPWVEPALADVLTKALARAPSDRFATIHELSAALAPFAGTSGTGEDELVSVASHRRTTVTPRRDATAPLPETTGQPFSVTSNRTAARIGAPRPWRGLVVALGLGLLIVPAAGFGIVKLAKPPPASGVVADAPPPVAPLPAASVAPTSEPAPRPLPGAAPVESAVVIAKPPPLTTSRKLRSVVDAGRPAAAVTHTPAATATATTGRGVTATDLPQGP